MDRDIFHCIRLLRALYNLSLNTSNDEAYVTSLGHLFQCLTTLLVKQFISYVQRMSTLFQFKTVAPCPVTTAPAKSLSPSFL